VGKVLVKKAISAQYPVGAGAPIMVMGGGGGGGGGARGRTKREIAGGALGGLVGVAGALTGQHRSLGGLAQSMISGGAQGKQLGGALGRVGVSRTRQAGADLDEEARRDYARMTAEGRFEGRKYDVNDRMNPATMRSRVQEIRAEDAMAREEAKRQNAQAVADAKAFGSERGEERRRMAEYADRMRGGMSVDEFGQKVGVYEAMRNQTQQAKQAHRAQQTPPTALELGQIPPMPPSQEAVDSSAGAQIVDVENLAEKQAQTEGMDHTDRLSPAEMPSPQGNNPSALPENQVKVMNSQEQIEAAKRMAESRKEQME
tara:strand:+ start:13465 stop:14409 length:945 start_codon:yes stop_codon:yes gene_type:complete